MTFTNLQMTERDDDSDHTKVNIWTLITQTKATQKIKSLDINAEKKSENRIALSQTDFIFTVTY